MVRTHKGQGFTLIELLVVISIISILSAIVYTNYNQARSSARDDIRKSELKEMQLAIELYKAQEGSYPANLADIAPNFIQAIPDGPLGNGYTYTPGCSGSCYKLSTNDVESQEISGYQDEFAECAQSCGCGPDAQTYAVYSFGGECL